MSFLHVDRILVSCKCLSHSGKLHSLRCVYCPSRHLHAAAAGLLQEVCRRYRSTAAVAGQPAAAAPQHSAPDMELGQWVIWVIFHVRVIIFTRRETRVFPVFEKMPKMQNIHLKAEMTKVIVRCLLLD